MTNLLNGLKILIQYADSAQKERVDCHTSGVYLNGIFQTKIVVGTTHMEDRLTLQGLGWFDYGGHWAFAP